MKRGFTLVELSIVLVIIGLLIGGILVAQSMIETAKIQNVIRAVQQVDVEVSNFKTQYNSLPGDSLLFTIQGNTVTDIDNRAHPAQDCIGDGFIEEEAYLSPGQPCGAAILPVGDGSNRFDCEIANFYVQLGQTGFGTGHYVSELPSNGGLLIQILQT